MTTQLNNPIHITAVMRVLLSAEKEVVKLYHDNLPYPVLQLFPSQYYWLKRVGITPDDLPLAEQTAVDFLAHWRENGRSTRAGNRYKDVTQLIPASDAPPSNNDNIVVMLEQIESKINTLLSLNGIQT